VQSGCDVAIHFTQDDIKSRGFRVGQLIGQSIGEFAPRQILATSQAVEEWSSWGMENGPDTSSDQVTHDSVEHTAADGGNGRIAQQLPQHRIAQFSTEIARSYANHGVKAYPCPINLVAQAVVHFRRLLGDLLQPTVACAK
jgi:hypothetical protein